MDFATLKRVSFAAPPADPAAATRPGLVTRAARRRFLAIREATQALDLVPGPGETLHGLMTGTYDLMHLLLVLVDKLAVPIRRMKIATLSLSVKNVAEMTGLLDAGKVRSLDLLCSDFFRKHDQEIFAGLLAEFTRRGQRVAAARSHCKLVTIAAGDGRRFTLEGSANLRINHNQEQFCLTQDPALHRFYATWIGQMVTKHEVHTSDGAEAG
jgi:hypothetical protein